MFTISINIPETEKRDVLIHRLSGKPGISKVSARGNHLYITYDPVKAPPVLIQRWIKQNHGLVPVAG